MAGLGGDDDAIFDHGSEPDPGQSSVDVGGGGDDHAAISDAIANLSRQGGRDSTSAPPQARQAPPPAARQQQEQQPDGIEDRSTAGLLRALLDERSTRQNMERELGEFRRIREDQERQQRANQTPFDQRLFEQPHETVNGAIDERIQPIESRLQTMAMDLDFRLAKVTHGAENFDQAFAAWYELVGNPNQPNPNLYWHIAGSPNPGDTLIAWHKQARAMSEVGDDLDAYRNKVEQEILAKYGLAPQGEASPAPARNGNGAQASRQRDPDTGQFTSTPRHEVRLPTATSRAGRAGSGTPAAEMDGSDDAIFDAGRPQRR